MPEIDKNKKTIEAYDNNPQFYADTFDNYGARVEDVERALKLNMSGVDKVLELGCGNGRDAQYIISKVGADNYLGTDASSELIKLAREKVSHGTFLIGDMRDLDVSYETYGIIFSFAAMLHLKREDLVDLINKCHKILRIGGILYISTKYGDYREIEIENLGCKKYYYSYTSKDIKEIASVGFEVLYNVIQDSDYGPELVIALKKI